ncbi:hypothetical protein A2Z67_06430 [Candidatus Woesebacteria bacterium RBG_13_36_22]|uniref:Outer membrane protein beta-barrel domain-containing protein n=1 Tax=Candidatus Woesebacteria bacterium RBG_13_36_22 TaxID=1802478 RepID=A0A1F7X0U7_9BACT|nr:MAG: hypothetical protein A2Z67_06430 [Candidatus Woesebacteria bacterium RBG_13_36_22]
MNHLTLKDMKIKSMLFIICFIGQSFIISAQQYAIDKKATIISGSGSLMSQGGDLFEDTDGNNATIVTITPTINHFITKNFFIGGGLEISVESQGNYSSNAIGIGPQIGYVFGAPHSTALPFLDLGIRYYKMNIDYGASDDYQFSGSNISLGFGVIIPVKTHIGLFFEGGYHMMDLKDKDNDDSYSGNILSIGIGIAGLLFNSEK